MRIISGKYRGRLLRAPSGRSVRPTGDRMKESMFSALGDACNCAGVLDLFAGSGALGLEALSRGAGKVTFVERSRAALDALEANISALGAREFCTVVRDEALDFLKRLDREAPFDLVFADPPFRHNEAERVLEWWLDYRRKGMTLILEFPSDRLPDSPAGPRPPAKTARFGRSAYSIYLAE